MRPSWDDVWLEMARAIAKRSRCVRSAVGCIVTNPHNAVVAVGYNGPPAGFLSDEMSSLSQCSGWCPRARTGGGPAFYDDCVSSHAEMNALVRGARSDFEGGTMYITRVPCYTCAKVIANSGIARVVFHVAPEDTEREPDRSIEFMRECGLSVVVWDG